MSLRKPRRGLCPFPWFGGGSISWIPCMDRDNRLGAGAWGLRWASSGSRPTDWPKQVLSSALADPGL